MKIIKKFHEILVIFKVFQNNENEISKDNHRNSLKRSFRNSQKKVSGWLGNTTNITLFQP
jgi:hypothetical protein